uniref:DNA-binding response regulator n=1 Tax=Streptococcus equinus TaxID=1335 RepID=A0A077JIP1_STREI|nr:DNA-binding response regulator [Streptococcus equinus]
MLKQHLRKKGYVAESVKDWELILQEVDIFSPDLILLDLTIPEHDGFFWLTKLRYLTSVPIFVVSAAEVDLNGVRAITLGADDYIEKPFNIEMLIAKIGVMLNRSKGINLTTRLIEVDDISLDTMTSDLRYLKNNAHVKLTQTEMIILKLLLININNTLSKKEIISGLWDGNQFINENVLNVNISRLRTKLESLGIADRLITERGRGYRFIDEK